MSIKGDTGRAMRTERGSLKTASLALAMTLALSATGCAKIGEVMGMFKFKQANQAYVSQDYERAVTLYEETVKNDPNNAIVYFYLGNSYDNLYKPSEKGKPENDAIMAKAVDNYALAVEKLDANDPTQAKIKGLALQYLMAAYGADKLDDPVKAEPVIIRLIQLDPAEPANYFQLGKLYEDAGEYEAAEKVYTAAKDAKGTDPNVYMQLAAFYSRQGNFPKTIEAYEQRAQTEPNNPEGFYAIATQYWDQAYRGPGVKEADKKAYVQKGNVAIDKAIEIRPDYVEALVYKNLLLRLQANLESNPSTQQALIKQADSFRDKAEEIRKRKATGVGD
jgi:tetratricopeptide (TPR) repeat protein